MKKTQPEIEKPRDIQSDLYCVMVFYFIYG